MLLALPIAVKQLEVYSSVDKKLRRTNETYAISVVSYTYCINRVPEEDLRSKDYLGKGATV